MAITIVNIYSSLSNFYKSIEFIILQKVDKTNFILPL